MTLRPYAATAAAAVLLTLAAAPARALPPLNRVIDDPTEPGKAYDITQVKLRSAPNTKRPAVVLVSHARKVATGDVVDVWFDFDGDKTPDLHVHGDAFSEYTVHLTDSFTDDGKDISKKDCARLAMGGSTSKVRLFPACVGTPVSFAVAVRSTSQGSPQSAVDWAPGTMKFSKKVLAAPLT